MSISSGPHKSPSHSHPHVRAACGGCESLVAPPPAFTLIGNTINQVNAAPLPRPLTWTISVFPSCIFQVLPHQVLDPLLLFIRLIDVPLLDSLSFSDGEIVLTLRQWFILDYTVIRFVCYVYVCFRWYSPFLYCCSSLKEISVLISLYIFLLLLFIKEKLLFIRAFVFFC